MRIGLGIGIGMFRGLQPPPPTQQQWVINGSDVQQAPEGPTVIWTVNGSAVSYIEV